MVQETGRLYSSRQRSERPWVELLTTKPIWTPEHSVTSLQAVKLYSRPHFPFWSCLWTRSSTSEETGWGWERSTCKRQVKYCDILERSCWRFLAAQITILPFYLQPKKGPETLSRWLSITRQAWSNSGPGAFVPCSLLLAGSRLLSLSGAGGSQWDFINSPLHSITNRAMHRWI